MTRPLIPTKVLRGVINRARVNQRSYDICYNSKTRLWVDKPTTDPIHKDWKHFATIHCDGRMEKNDG